MGNQADLDRSAHAVRERQIAQCTRYVDELKAEAIVLLAEISGASPVFGLQTLRAVYGKLEDLEANLHALNEEFDCA